MGKGIGSNKKAMESVPMKLIVILVAIAFIVPIAYYTINNDIERQTKSDIIDGMDELANAIRFVYDKGTLESREVTLDFGSSRFSGLSSIVIGDKIGEHPGMNQSVISHKYLSTWEHNAITDPNIPVTSPNNSALELDGYGKWDLVVQKNTIGFTDFVVVRLKGQEGEVKMPDLFVGSINVIDNPAEPVVELTDEEWEEYKPEMTTPLIPSGYQVSALIKNFGTLATDDPNSKWVDGIGKDNGAIRVLFIDYIVERNETRQIGEPIIIDHLEPYEEITITASQSWRVIDYLYHDDAFDRTLLNRKIIVQVDYIEYEVDETSEMIEGDNIDEINGDNNNREYLPVVDYYIDERNETRQIDEPIIIDHLEPNEEITITASQSWKVIDSPYHDDAFDRTLLNRKIIAQVDYIEY
ncbi:MAG: hypothetical protein KAS16_06190 [Thermoplasmata archaeon]|nr:hypothetical protein [Thermoplasmata archaeon]